jgi:hypothetical protein
MGIKCDTDGNVYAGCADGVEVWNPGGTFLGVIGVEGRLASSEYQPAFDVNYYTRRRDEFLPCQGGGDVFVCRAEVMETSLWLQSGGVALEHDNVDGYRCRGQQLYLT